MNELALAIGSVVVIWWLSTGVVLRIVWLPPRAHRWSVAVFSALGLAGLYGVVATRGVESVGAAYLAFGCALAVWAWHELTFLLGVISGPRKTPCPPEAHGWQRFRYATATVIHHELALAITVLVLVALTWGAPNQVATWTFLVLWVMRLSAKLNVFVGVRNLAHEFIPPHLRYLTSYFRKARPSPLMLVSFLGAGAIMLPLVDAVRAPGASGFTIAGHTLVATILALAVVEHVFLAIPMPDAALWRWILRSDRPTSHTSSKVCTSNARTVQAEVTASSL